MSGAPHAAMTVIVLVMHVPLCVRKTWLPAWFGKHAHPPTWSSVLGGMLPVLLVAKFRSRGCHPTTEIDTRALLKLRHTIAHDYATTLMTALGIF